MAPEIADPDVEPVMVTMVFDATDADALLSVLSHYVVLSRGHEGCLNIDMVASTTTPGRITLIQKWATVEHQQTHFDSADMVTMAGSCSGLLESAPLIDLHEPVTMHDQR